MTKKNWMILVSGFVIGLNLSAIIIKLALGGVPTFSVAGLAFGFWALMVAVHDE